MIAKRHSIFISYRRIDSGYAVGRIYENLTAAFGHEAVFRDTDVILPGTDFLDAIRDALTSCQIVLVVIGTDWLRIMQERNPEGAEDVPPDNVRMEIEIALARYRAVGSRVYPLFLHTAAMPTENE